MRKIKILASVVLITAFFTACNNVSNPVSSQNDGNSSTVVFEESINDAMAENCKIHEEADDYSYATSEIVPILLNSDSILVSGPGAAAEGTKVTITTAGTYSLKGTLTEGQLIVDCQDEAVVKIIFDGVNITNTSGSPVFIKNANKTVIFLAESTENFVTDGQVYVFENADEDEPNAAVFSSDNLTICGGGSLNVDANFNDGIAGKDGLIIKNGNISINSVDDGIRGKDYLVIKGGNINVNCGGDGLKSDNDEDACKGFIHIETGVLNIISGGDAITAESDVLITNGQGQLTTGGGSSRYVSSDSSAKGIKGLVNTIIDDGSFTFSAADDAIHTNGNLVINGGVFEIATSDDAIHADSTLGINGGNIRITKSHEGIESAIITINGGNINIISSDDGINGAGGNDGSGIDGRPGQNPFSGSGNYYLYINGGYIYINSKGDGIDVNGTIVMTGGDVIIDGPTSNANGALDYDSSFKIEGGLLLAAGSSGMAQAPGANSTQYSVFLSFSTKQAGTLVHIQNSNGENVFSFTPAKSYQSIVFSSPAITKGSTYDVYFGGSSTGTLKDGVYTNGIYTPGTKYTSFTVSGIVTRIR